MILLPFAFIYTLSSEISLRYGFGVRFGAIATGLSVKYGMVTASLQWCMDFPASDRSLTNMADALSVYFGMLASHSCLKLDVSAS